MRYITTVLAILFSSVAFAQQALSPVQQCTNHQHELVLSDITLQELRARCGNIMRQAYELEMEIKQLKDENAKLKEEAAKMKASILGVSDAPAKTE